MRLLRRGVTIPACLLGAVVGVGTAPVWIPGLWLTDRITGRTTRRAALLLTGGLVIDSLALLALGWVWLVRGLPLQRGIEADRARNFRVQRWWSRSLLAWGRRVYQVRLEVEGALLPLHGPLLVFARHCSLADTLLPAVLVADRGHLLLRYVAKDALRWEPCLDVLGGRLSTVFLRRGAGGGADQVAAAARELAGDEGMMLFPEGTRFSPAKRDRRLRQLEAEDPLRAALARQLTHVLPPRRGGVGAALTARPEADVLFLEHTGLEGLGTLADLTRRDLVGRTVRVRLRRIPAATVPRGEEAWGDWLDAQWKELDAWVGEAREIRSRSPS